MGLIPAGAGQMGFKVFDGAAEGAHPRRCGADYTTV